MEANKILVGDGYSKVLSPMIGDVVIYRSGNTIIHSAVVSWISGGEVTVWGLNGTETYPNESSVKNGFSGYSHYEYYRQ